MIGRTIGGYRIVEQVGMGGMATVYKAYDASTDRYVALKTLPEQYSKDPQFVERFRREAIAIAKLEHLHILPLFAYGEDEGVAYLAMRYLPAGTLSNFIRQKGQMPLEEVARILNQISGALDHAHANGVLHRDIKPSNVLIDKDTNIYLTDFGIARMVEGTVDLTGDAILGTPQYMSPEQCQGRKDLTPASDQYSLGVVLYEMVTGRVPFQAETPLAVIIMQLNGAELPLPTLLRPDLPESAERVILKALARDPADRYPTCEAMARAFTQAIGEVQSVTEASPLPGTKSTPLSQPAAPLTNQIDNAPTTLQPTPPARPALSPTLIGALVIVGVVIIGGLVLLAGRPPAAIATATPPPTSAQIAAALPSATVVIVTVAPSATTIKVTTLPSATVVEVTTAPTATAVVATAAQPTNGLPVIVSTLIAQGDADAAIKLLSPAIDQTPKDAPLYLLRGQAYQQSDNSDAALTDFTQAITLSPDLADAYVHRAAIYLRQNDTESAIKDLTQAIKLQPDRADAYATRGSIFRDLNDFDQALGDYGKSIALDSKNPQWYADRARVYEYHGDLDSAVTDLNQAIALNPQFMDAYIQRGGDQHQRGQFELALADFMSARKLDPSNGSAYSGAVENYLTVLDANGSLTGYDLGAALADANKAVELSPDNAGNLIDRAKVHSHRDEHDAAIGDLTQSITIYNQSADAYVIRGYEYITTGRYDQAHDDFNQAIELNPDSVEAYQGRIEAYLEAVDQDKPWKDYDLNAALADANAALALDSSNAITLLLRGKVYGRQGEKEKALADLKQTIETEPDMAWGYQERGYVYASIGMTDAAVADFQKAIELDPTDAWYYVGLGDTLYDAGRHTEALTAYQTYVKQAGADAAEYVRERITELEKSS